jgi:3-hydroxyisobutyrate dehydrogenase-like beta-hydroxyacid dehydrogenase
VTGSESRPPEEAATAAPDPSGAGRVAFLGMGIMGSRMARNLRGAGFDVVVWNRTRSRAEEVGEPVADTPAAAAEGARIVITMVVDAPEVEAVLFGEDGAAAAMQAGSLVVDMSTIAPSAVKRIAERLGESVIGFVDAPVTGSKPRAEDGTLTIMAGGEQADFERARPLFEAMGKLVVHAGPSGHGAMVKLLNNAVAAINAAAIAEAFDVGEAYGLDMERLVEVMSAGSAGSVMLGLKAQPMLDRSYDPLFKLAHMLKDVRHALAEAEALGGRFDLAADVESLYSAADAMGLGDEDFAAVAEAVRARQGADAA